MLNLARGLTGELDVRIRARGGDLDSDDRCSSVSRLHGSMHDPTLRDTLKETARGAMHPRSHRFRSALLVAQVALAMVLLVGAGLMICTLTAYERGEPGLQSGWRAHATAFRSKAAGQSRRASPRSGAIW